MPPSFLPSESKQEAVARLYAVAGVPSEPLGPGSKEKKSALTSINNSLQLGADNSAPKNILARQILEQLGRNWEHGFSSTGQTITLAGLNAILEASESLLHNQAELEVRHLDPALPEWFQPARDKLEAVRRISSITGGRPQELGPGSKERKSVLTDLVANLGLPLNTGMTKTRLAEAIAATLEVPWNNSCWSTGETITLNGLNALLAGVERRELSGHSATRNRLRQEASLLVAALAVACPKAWDGRTCINQMIAGEYAKALQTEWVGWYFEFIGLPALINSYGGGPLRIGTTTFDYSRQFVWDLKTHSQKGLAAPGDISADAPLNDRDSILKCVEEHRSIGFLILSGAPTFDGLAEFDAWHRSLRNKPQSRSKNPRALKVSLTPVAIEAYVFDGIEEVNAAMDQKILKPFNQGRQQNGAPRKPKLHLALKRAREAGHVMASHDFTSSVI